MHDKHPVGCVLHAAQPGDELVAVGMGGGGVELDHFRPYGNVLPAVALSTGTGLGPMLQPSPSTSEYSISVLAGRVSPTLIIALS